MGTPPGFDYDSAFSRNLGLISPQEQQRLRHCRVAIAGLGGVGGAHVLTHVRMGIGKFHLADFDTFEVKLDRLLSSKRSLANDMLNGTGEISIQELARDILN